MDEILIILISISFFIILMVVFRLIMSSISEQKRIEENQRRRVEHQRRREAYIRALENNSLEVTPEQFFALKNGSQLQDFTGVYILYNQTKQMYYVGQGKSVFKRVNAHFTGHGNGDVYADYKYGDYFTIRMISLVNSGYNNLDELERQTILAYNAYYEGYNRTRGNRG